jgi:hypothetical protein
MWGKDQRVNGEALGTSQYTPETVTARTYAPIALR